MLVVLKHLVVNKVNEKIESALGLVVMEMSPHLASLEMSELGHGTGRLAAWFFLHNCSDADSLSCQ